MPTATSAFYGAIEKAAAGERLSYEEGLALLEGNDLTALGAGADEVRARKHPEGFVTYCVDRNINYTNVCDVYCTFCAFYRPPGEHPESYVLTRDQIREKLRALYAAGGRQVLLQGGHHPDLRIGWYEDLFRWMKSEFSGLHLHALSPPEIHHISKLEDMPYEIVISRLREAGLDSIPGGGGEILVDRVRRKIARLKVDADGWLAVMRAAHRLGVRSTATMMFGHVETPEERIEHLDRLRRLQDETGGFTAFICWTFQNDGSATLRAPTVGSSEYLRMLAISRLYLDNFDNVQSSWVTQGKKVGELSLHYGANDMGSTMLEENVVSAAGTVYCMNETDLHRMARAAGFEPRRRNFFYELI
ncbi:MAG: dehypoxanthine futalosine cyclase [Candidatus Tectomicrobia bacterium]|uniref:Cyclic dehypoxanthine futalosine synthase n=1 Tax=Tectimicrobiota bacterium TaxID=2528274 RepID=A0A932I0X9_UNCTE|nr:dehypoxanthine futalosine cyclase [Candidatus Tectomicrobia bacterium]